MQSKHQIMCHSFTRQVYNLFQDLWNKASGFLERCKKVQKGANNLKGAAPSAPPNLFPNLWKQNRSNLA